MVKPTWEDRDLPVLRAIVELSDELPHEKALRIDCRVIAERTGLDLKIVARALLALEAESPPFFRVRAIESAGDYRAISSVTSPTGHARRTVGTWPKPEDRVDQLVEVLRQVAEKQPDSEKKSALRKTAEFIGGVGREVATDVLVKVATGG